MTRAGAHHAALAAAALAALAFGPAQAATLPSAQGPIPVSDSAGHPFDSTLYQLQPFDLSHYGYVEQECFYSGVANVYQYENLADPADNQVQLIASGNYPLG